MPSNSSTHSQDEIEYEREHEEVCASDSDLEDPREEKRRKRKEKGKSKKRRRRSSSKKRRKDKKSRKKTKKSRKKTRKNKDDKLTGAAARKAALRNKRKNHVINIKNKFEYDDDSSDDEEESNKLVVVLLVILAVLVGFYFFHQHKHSHKKAKSMRVTMRDNSILEDIADGKGFDFDKVQSALSEVDLNAMKGLNEDQRGQMNEWLQKMQDPKNKEILEKAKDIKDPVEKQKYLSKHGLDRKNMMAGMNLSAEQQKQMEELNIDQFMNMSQDDQKAMSDRLMNNQLFKDIQKDPNKIGQLLQDPNKLTKNLGDVLGKGFDMKGISKMFEGFGAK